MTPTSTTQLTVTHEFNAGGVQYSVGDVVAPEAPAAWPEGALEARLENKFLKFVTVPVEAVPTPEPDLITQLEAMSKSELAELAASHGLTLNKDSMNKADMLLEITTHLATLK
jgi:hypothetical protein